MLKERDKGEYYLNRCGCCGNWISIGTFICRICEEKQRLEREVLLRNQIRGRDFAGVPEQGQRFPRG